MQGAPLVSFDLDIVPEPLEPNLTRLTRALVEMQAHVKYTGRVLNLPDGSWIRAARLWNLSTIHGDLDVLMVHPGEHDYGMLRESARSVEIDAGRIFLASVDDLIAMKEIANRDKDHLALPILRWLRDNPDA